MPYLTIARIDGDPDRLADAYRRTAEQMDSVGRDHGLILHAGGRAPDGFVIVNLWPSRDGSLAAAQDPRRLDALRQAALGADGQRKEHFELERYVLFGSTA
jgi:hypothetical protein